LLLILSKHEPHVIIKLFLKKVAYIRKIHLKSTRRKLVLFTLNGFDNQERNLTFVKTDFEVLKLKFHACNFKQTLYPLHVLNVAWPWQHKKFCSVPDCQTSMCKPRH